MNLIPGCSCRLFILVQDVHLQAGEQNSSSLQHLHRLLAQPAVYLQTAKHTAWNSRTESTHDEEPKAPKLKEGPIMNLTMILKLTTRNITI